MAKSLRDCARQLNDDDFLSMAKDAESAMLDAESIDIPAVNVTQHSQRHRELAQRSLRASDSLQSIESRDSCISRPMRIQIPTISKTSGRSKPSELESHLRNVDKAFQEEDFDKASAELNLAILAAPRAPWPWEKRVQLLESRKDLERHIDAIYQKRREMLCKCPECELAGRGLYRSVVCQNLGITPLAEQGVPNLDALQSCFAYRWAGDSDRDPLSKIWQKHKDDPRDRIWAPTFAVLIMEYLAERNPDYCNRVDVMVCVPPDPVRMAKRGTDPVENVCEFLSKLICVPFVKGALEKEAQDSFRTMGRRERANTARDMFSFTKGQNLQDLTVLLVDDVVTTGSTIQNCARILKNQGRAAKIKGLSLFRSESSLRAEQLEAERDAADCECCD